MKRLKKHPSLGLFCLLLFLPFMVAGPSLAECNMTPADLDAAVSSCAGDLDCFVSLAKSNISCAANIAWYFMIVYAPDNPDAVLNSFLAELPNSSSGALTTAIGAAHQANQNEQKAGSTTAANEYPYVYGQ